MNAFAAALEPVLGTLAIPCLICFVVGLVFLFIEAVTPGFGAAGFLGFGCLLAVVIMQIIGNRPLPALIVCAVLLIIIIALLVFFVHSFQSGKLSKSRIILNDNIVAESTPLGTDAYQQLIGKQGTAITPLRPAGIALIDGIRYNVQTDGTFVEKDSGITVVSVESLRITVK